MAKNTKLSLSTALLELLEAKPLDKITVTELVKKCGVNRQTFYYNFRVYMTLWNGRLWRM